MTHEELAVIRERASENHHDHSLLYAQRDRRALLAELDSVRADRDERAVQKSQFFSAMETLQDEKHAITNEVAVVLMMLDELAELWGDEGKFRTCRDRLRKLVSR